MNKFKCVGCGECCRHIRGMANSEDKEFLSEFAYGRMPLVQLQPINMISFPLWDWEAKRFRQWEKHAGVDAGIKESRAVYDLDSKNAIVLTYYMDNDSCPFLLNNKCLIYDRKRSFVCRLFPFNRGPFLKTGQEGFYGMFGACPSMKEVLQGIPNPMKDAVSYLQNAMPDELLNVVQHDIVTEWANKTIVDMIRKKMIRPAVNYPYRFLQKRISNSEKVDFSSFLIKCGYYTSSEMARLIERFDNNQDAADAIKAFLA